jgi:MFS family permease
MAHLPADTLRNRTFVGLLIAQFLAAFNDQAIHASAMFFALHKGTLTEAQAITLMPILFYSPWAIFCTLAAYFADRFSKRHSLVIWKAAEIGITLIATVGFYLGSVHHTDAGPWIVLGCVFLMGLHSAFFVPAKYGIMPEILSSQMLSRGNGLLESLSFIAVILGTVSGGVMSFLFQRREVVIGLILLALAVVGAVSSLMIATVPAANPHRSFPRNLYAPLAGSLRSLLGARPLRLAVMGIAFFTFVVAFMRATVYLLGEAQNPRWNEFQTSFVVGMSALGIGLGAPLAGFLSGRKVELGLVPIGAIGMILGTVAAAVILTRLTGAAMVLGLIACIVVVGFCTGFYLVPMYTLLQHRAPKTSKGDAVATSNFINVTGAILASAVSAAVVFLAHQTGVTPTIDQTDAVARGWLTRATYDRHGRLEYVEIRNLDGSVRKIGTEPGSTGAAADELPDLPLATGQPRATILKVESGVEENSPVVVSRYEVRGVKYYELRPEGTPLTTEYDEEPLPRYLFLGAAVVSLLMLVALCQQMPDLLSRAAWVVRSLGEVRLHVVGTEHVPIDGPVVLVTNCRDTRAYRDVVSGTERPVRFAYTKLTDDGLERAVRAVQAGTVLALSAEAADLLPVLQQRLPATYLPVYYGPMLAEQNGPVPDGTMRVAFGAPLPHDATPDDVQAAIRRAGAMSEAEE